MIFVCPVIIDFISKIFIHTFDSSCIIIHYGIGQAHVIIYCRYLSDQIIPKLFIHRTKIILLYSSTDLTESVKNNRHRMLKEKQWYSLKVCTPTLCNMAACQRPINLNWPPSWIGLS